MSRLKELRLHGFKTFADPTRFVFERGVTAVIGPNGSGKSNMADAVRWVLGEQSNRSLRTRRADDVIFAGSQGRRPQGMAEAVLTLDNTDHWLPIDFAEVSIGRRAFRSGETEYLINGARARLKEVVELLAGGRLGANELVVVGQGTVDAALSLRPEERRQLFEEAAGVKNLQVRKNEALGRLLRARDNLTRVSDLIAELKPQVRRLALQAQHQEEHDAMGRRAHGLVVEAHRRREVTARESLGEARRRMASAEAALEALRAEESAGRQAIAQAEAGYWEAEGAARSAAERLEHAREARIRTEAVVEGAARRHADLAALIAREEAELAETMATLEVTPDGADPQAESKWEAAREAEGAWRAAAAELDAVDLALVAVEQEFAEAWASAGASIAEAARRDEASMRLRARVEQIEGELQAATTTETEAAAACAPAQAQLVSATATEVEAVAAMEAADTAAEAAERQAEVDRARAATLAERIGGLQSELGVLQERAGGDAALGPMLAAAGWQSLIETIDPPQAAWAAIEALVGGELRQALVWRDAHVADHAATARGSARLLAGEDTGQDEPSAAVREAALAAVRATVTLREWIGTIKGPRLFARTVVAPDLNTLLQGWRNLPPGWCAVTADGDLADERGLLVVRGRADEASGEAARQHARVKELVELVARLESEHEDAGRVAAQSLLAWADARQDRDMAAERHAEAQREAAIARGGQERAEGALARARDLVQALSVELDDARSATAAGLVDSSGVTPGAGALERLAPAAADARERRALLAAQRDRRRAAWQAAQAAADAIDTGWGDARYQRAVLAARRDQLTGALARDQIALAAMDAERLAAADGIEAAANADREAAEQRAAADVERDRLRAELLDSERAGGGAASRLAELERALQSAAIDAQRLEDELVAIGRERDLAIESLPVADTHAPLVGDGSAPSDLEAASAETIEAELKRVRRTLAQIGSVNPFAIEEHRELAGRMDALTVQDADLNAAIGSTEQLIGRLEGEIAGQFNAAFVAIGAKFDEFCRLLFAGGSASLQMSDGREGELADGIEIAVRPPGKRLQRLAMLSGGERALAGVALLFAMLSVNPVPFCILDEVDAALDEANIGRFADALRLLSQTIDFVVITHNRATIETADTIYGVTMTDAAVSRLLSLRLADLPVEVGVG